MSNVCKTILGPEGEADIIHCTLNEPGGLCVAGQNVYIADTNNHIIRVLDLETKSVTNVSTF